MAILGLPAGVSAGNESRVLTSENAPALRPSGAAVDLLPSPADAMAAFHKVESWVGDWNVPGDAGDLPAVSAAAITLRLDGSLIGRGSAISARPEGDAGVILAAAKQALDEATSRMPVERDALFEQSLRRMAPSIAISLELAGELIPFEPAEYADASRSLSPGLEGVAVRMGERIDAILPGAMLANTTEPGAALAAAVSRLTGDPALGLKRPGDLADEHGAVFYRFRTIHLAHPRGGMPPIFLHRGGRTVERNELASAGLREWADGMAQFLMRGIVMAHDGPAMAGELNPVTGVVRPDSVSGVHVAIGALALVRYSQVPGVDPGRAAQARQGARRLLEGLLDLELSTDLFGRGGPAAVATAAVAASVLEELGFPVAQPAAGQPIEPGTSARLPDGADPLERLALIVSATLRDVQGDMPPAASQLLAWGLAQMDGSRESAHDRLRRLFRETPPGHLVSIMPWAGWAELSLAGEGDIPAAVALREMREQVWKHQLTRDDLAFENLDLAGGIVFTASRNPLPNWHAARPLAFIATMLADPRLTSDDEFPGELSRLLTSLRFLRQLSAGEAEGHMYRSPETAMWGTRASVYDQRMPPEATAITLLTVCELFRSLEIINQRQRAAAGADAER